MVMLVFKLMLKSIMIGGFSFEDLCIISWFYCWFSSFSWFFWLELVFELKGKFVNMVSGLGDCMEISFDDFVIELFLLSKENESDGEVGESEGWLVFYCSGEGGGGGLGIGWWVSDMVLFSSSGSLVLSSGGSDSKSFIVFGGFGGGGKSVILVEVGLWWSSFFFVVWYYIGDFEVILINLFSFFLVNF